MGLSIKVERPDRWPMQRGIAFIPASFWVPWAMEELLPRTTIIWLT